MSNGNGNGRFTRWMANGAMATIAWFVLLAVYTTFRILKIDDPVLTSSFQLLTGGWIGNLAFGIGQKNKQTEKIAEEAKAKIEELEQTVSEVTGTKDV